VTACGVTRGEEEHGFHRLAHDGAETAPGGCRFMTLTARTAVKIMEEGRRHYRGASRLFTRDRAPAATVAMARPDE